MAFQEGERGRRSVQSPGHDPSPSMGLIEEAQVERLRQVFETIAPARDAEHGRRGPCRRSSRKGSILLSACRSTLG
jgi:hypothetical protein